MATEGWQEWADDWSSNGKYILYDRAKPQGQHDLWVLRRGEDGKFEPAPFLVSEFDVRAGQFSPDGQYVAYASDESGTYEVYVTTFPEADRKWKVSHDGGIQPLWSKSGTELYYVNDYTLHAVKVTYEPEFSPGTPEPLFRALGFAGSLLRRYDVSADGRFLVREMASDAPSTVRVVQNWFEEFRGR